MRRIKLAVALLLAASPVALPAIITRHDVDDAEYRALGEQYRGTVVDIALPRKDGTPNYGNGAGTLIAPRWVLTAAHVAVHIKLGHKLSRLTTPHSVYIADKPHRVEAVFIHPDWVDFDSLADVALVKLAAPVGDGQPACLYPRNDEVGKVAVLAGRGLFGTGLTGPGKGLGTLRGSTVRIGGTDADGSRLYWDFRAPGDPEVTKLEGISGPGDSGGPAFLRYNGGLCVAGVSSMQDDKGLGEGRYTVREFYPRVSWFKPWIEATMRDQR